MTTYKTFKRSATNFKQFFNARKITVDTGLTYEEAQRQCERFNNNRTPTQIRKGTKMEFVSE
jgi:hypothetical protein